MAATKKQNPKYVKSNQKSGKSYTEHSITHPDDTKPAVLRVSMVLSSGELVLIDKANKNIKVFDTNYQCVDVMKLTTFPFDACASNRKSSEFYVTEPEMKSIHCIQVDRNKMTLKSSRCIDEDCRGITCWKSGIAVTVMREWSFGYFPALGLLNYKCEVTKKMFETEAHKAMFSAPWYLESIQNGSKIIVSDQGKKSLFCINTKNLEIIFEYKSSELTNPRSVARDADDNIYVSGGSDICASTVFKISPDGKFARKCLTYKDDTLNYPTGIAYNRNINAIVLQADRDRPTIRVYPVLTTVPSTVGRLMSLGVSTSTKPVIASK